MMALQSSRQTAWRYKVSVLLRQQERLPGAAGVADGNATRCCLTKQIPALCFRNRPKPNLSASPDPQCHARLAAETAPALCAGRTHMENSQPQPKERGALLPSQRKAQVPLNILQLR